ncbi:exo-alpha-sialidase [Streptomyces virginiae]|uniref:exo-alpha-sialidase n=1 Tax=Streptomyces virginiae TaxID=1961 RepID=UPI00363A4ED0
MVLAAVWAVLAAALAPADVAEAADIPGGHADVFRQNEIVGGTTYACFRIPSVVKTRQGNLLAFAEGRIGTCGDSGSIDIVMKRSADGGATWTDPQVVARHSAESYVHNPVPVVDTANSTSDRVVLLYARSYKHIYRTVSTDGGLTWGPAADISRDVWPSDVNVGAWPNGQLGVGPAHGIQLTKGAHAGRLVVGLWIRSAPGAGRTEAEGERPDMGVGLIRSDDGGDTWTVGRAYSLKAEPEIGAQEPSVFERADGSLVVVARNEEAGPLDNPRNKNRAAYAVSEDQGETITDLQLLPDLGLPAMGIQTSTLTVPQVGRDLAKEGTAGFGRALLASPADPVARKNLTIRSSFDGGLTWQSPAQGKTVYAGASGYSDMVAMGGGKYGIVFESGTASPYEYIRFDTFTESDLDDQPERPEDLTYNQNTAALATSAPDQLHLFATTQGGELGNWFKNADGTVQQGVWGKGTEGETVSFSYGDQQHVLVRGADDSLVHRFWNPATSTVAEQVWAAPGSVAGAPTAIVTSGQQHAFVRATNGRLLHIFWDAGSGMNNQTWAEAGALAGDPVAVVYGEQQHVWAAGTDGKLHHWWWTKRIGLRHEIWSGTAKDTPTAFVYRGQQHVYARDDQGKLSHWWWDHQSQSVNRETLTPEATLTSRPTAFVYGGQQHVFARTSAHDLSHWWWDPTKGNKYALWPGSVHSAPVAQVVGSSQHVYGPASDGTLTHWWWNSADGIRQESWGGKIPTTQGG